jgi:hypothetical protein
MAIDIDQSSFKLMDPLSRLVLFIAGLVTIVALVLSIVGTATYSWYYNQDSFGNTVSYNFFTMCQGNLLNSTSTCIDMPRQTTMGISTQNAGALLVFALGLLGLAMLITLAMNFVQLTGILAFIAPIVHFFAALFMLASMAEGSRVLQYNNYSAHLVQTGHILTILSMGLTAFAGARLHTQYYN